jgi:hypothetical protein
MTLLREIAIAVRMAIVTLWLQSVGLAALILWIRRAVAGDLHRLRPFRSAVLVVRLTGAVIVLHGVLILFWASCHRRLCFSSWESALYFSASSYATVGYGRRSLTVKMANAGAAREHYRRVDVRISGASCFQQSLGTCCLPLVILRPIG